MKFLGQSFKVILIFACITTIGIFHRDIAVDDLKPKYANSASSFLSLDGMEVHYRDEGNPLDSIPILLIHGTASSLHTFDAWVESLKKTNRVIRMDLPAYGLTGPFPDANYDISHYTVFIKHFLTALKVRQCIIAGNSLGGQIAWNFTTENPKMVQKMILIAAAGYPIHSKSVPIAFKIGKSPVFSKLITLLTPRFLVKASVENVYYDKSKVTDALVDRYYNLTLRDGNRQAFIDRFKTSNNVNSYENIKKIQQPTLILWGAEDLLIPVDNAYKFQKDLPNSTLKILEKTGHVPMEESPDESLKPLLEFLKIGNGSHKL